MAWAARLRPGCLDGELSFEFARPQVEPLLLYSQAEVEQIEAACAVQAVQRGKAERRPLKAQLQQKRDARRAHAQQAQPSARERPARGCFGAPMPAPRRGRASAAGGPRRRRGAACARRLRWGPVAAARGRARSRRHACRPAALDPLRVPAPPVQEQREAATRREAPSLAQTLGADAMLDVTMLTPPMPPLPAGGWRLPIRLDAAQVAGLVARQAARRVGKGPLPCLTPPRHAPASCLLGLRPLRRTPERRLRSLEACRGPRSPERSTSLPLPNLSGGGA